MKNALNRYNLITLSAGTTMADEPLFNLTVVDRRIVDPLMRRTKFEELTQHELDYYKSYFENLQEVI